MAHAWDGADGLGGVSHTEAVMVVRALNDWLIARDKAGRGKDPETLAGLQEAALRLVVALCGSPAEDE